jgi:PAS domain S-box-containing protein
VLPGGATPAGLFADGGGREGTPSGESRLAELLAASRQLVDAAGRCRSVTEMLQAGIEILVGLLQVRYGAIGIRGGDGRFKTFVFSGLSSAQAAAIGALPTGAGVLGATFAENRPVRINHLASHPRLAGFPAHHPVMSHLLAAPLTWMGEDNGRIYLCDRHDGQPFAAADELVIENFAASLSLALDKMHEIELLRHTERQQQQGEERFSRLLDLVPEAIVITCDGIIDFVNTQSVKLFGAPTFRALLGRPIADFLDPSERDLSRRRLRLVAAGQRLTPTRFTVCGLDGHTVQVEVNSARIAFRGRPAILSVARDVTEENHQKAQLDRQYRQLLALHQLTEVIHRSTRSEHVFDKALDVLCATTGAQRAAILLMDRRKVMRYVVWRGLSDAYRQATEGRSPWRGKTPEPQPVLVEDPAQEPQLAAFADLIAREGIASLALFPVSHQGELIGKLMLCFDTPHRFTEEETRLALTVAEQLALAVMRQRAVDEVQRLNAELEERVRRRTAQLEQANRELEAFSYSVSHDLRAPLRALDGFSRILIEEYGDQLDLEANRYLDRIIAASARMERLIDDMLKLSRIGRSNMRVVTVDLSVLVADILDKLREAEPQRAADFVIEGGLTVEGDAGLLAIAMENLLGNAWKYSREQPQTRIQFGHAKADRQTVYFVRDNGTGFDMSHASRLFTPFHRLHSSTDFEGSGIGLAIVQRIIQRHGGRIWADSRPGRGAVFHFTLWEEGVPAELRAAVGRGSVT